MNLFNKPKLPGRVDIVMVTKRPQQFVDYYNQLVDFVNITRTQHRVDFEDGTFMLIGKQRPGIVGKIVIYDTAGNVVTVVI